MAELVENVSDTARWVAAYRARESARPDALFRDPLAERLAGARGHAIAAVAPRLTRNGWPLVARTKLIDDLVAASIASGCDRVLNLAAGLDTRPYRLELPSTLRWIEADLPGMIDEKERQLAGEKPRCRLERAKVDLADQAARRAFLERATDGASQALVITEGLLIYLDDAEVQALGRDLARPRVRWWVLDAVSPSVLQMNMRSMGRHLEQAPMKFAPADGVAFYERLGWRAIDVESMFLAALKWKRLPTPMRLLSFLYKEPNPRQLGKTMWSAVVRFEQQG